MSYLYKKYSCPVCFISPLLIEWELGTFDFYCAACKNGLDPSAKALIDTLTIKENNNKIRKNKQNNKDF